MRWMLQFAVELAAGPLIMLLTIGCFGALSRGQGGWRLNLITILIGQMGMAAALWAIPVSASRTGHDRLYEVAWQWDGAFDLLSALIAGVIWLLFVGIKAATRRRPHALTPWSPR